MINATRRLLSAMAVICLVASTAMAQDPRTPKKQAAMAEDQFDWPRFRGPDGNGISKETAWHPEALNTPKILWKANVGAGQSSVAIKGDRLYTMGNRANNDNISCLNIKDGKEVWTHSYPCNADDQPGPHATPTIDGGSVYTLSRSGHLFCLNAADGKVKWQKNLLSDFKVKEPGWGFAGSPVVFGDLLLIDAGDYGVCLKKATGDKVWASPAGTEGGHATPVLYKKGGKDFIAMLGSKSIQGIEPATGKKLWAYKWETHSVRPMNIPDPIVFDGKVFISTGYGKGCALIDISGPEAKLVWQNKNMRNQCSNSILLDGYVYGLDGNKGPKDELRCLELASGKVMWAKPLVWGGLMAADGKLIVIKNDGDVFVVKANPKAYEEIASAKGLLQKECWTAPVLCRGVIYFRNNIGDLIAVDVSK